MNLSRTFSARRDSYAKGMKDWTLRDDESVSILGDWREVFATLDRFVSNGWTFRLIVESLKGTRHDIVVRRGVYKSQQDGEVEGIGAAMTDATIGNFGTWCCVHGGEAVNTGAGKGYRTWNASRVLAIRATNDNREKETAITQAGFAYIAARNARHAQSNNGEKKDEN